jgi:hypothetical protein
VAWCYEEVFTDLHYGRGISGACCSSGPTGGHGLRRPAFWGWYGPFWDSYPYGLYDGYYHAPVTGTVKFDTSSKDAQVFINGAYAGTVGKLKTMHLQPGSYEIELRTSGRTQYAEKVYVVAGKTLHLNPDLLVQARP